MYVNVLRPLRRDVQVMCLSQCGDVHPLGNAAKDLRVGIQNGRRVVLDEVAEAAFSSHGCFHGGTLECTGELQLAEELDDEQAVAFASAYGLLWLKQANAAEVYQPLPKWTVRSAS